MTPPGYEQNFAEVKTPRFILHKRIHVRISIRDQGAAWWHDDQRFRKSFALDISD